MALLSADLACVSMPFAKPISTINTQTATETIVSTQTLIISATPSPTKTPLLTDGTTLETLEDGSFKFIDHDGGFSFVVPKNWVTFTADLSGLDNAFEKLGNNNNYLIFLNLNMKKMQDEGYRMFSIHSIYSKQELPPTISVRIFTDQASKNLSTDDIAVFAHEYIKHEYPETKDVYVYHVLNSTTNGYSTWIKFERETFSSNGSSINITETYILFQAYKSLVLINSSVPSELATELAPDLDIVSRSLRGMRP
jgi:hypothetical protein